MYRGAYIWEAGGAYNLLDVFFVYKKMVSPEYNWPEGWGGEGRVFKWKVHWTAYKKQFTTYENPIKRKMWSGFWWLRIYVYLELIFLHCMWQDSESGFVIFIQEVLNSWTTRIEEVKLLLIIW